MLPDVLIAPRFPDPLYFDEIPLDLDESPFDGSPVDETPLDLDAVLADARRCGGARAVVDVLVAALTDRRVRDDHDIDQYLDQLKSACRQTRRYRAAIPVFERIAELNPARRFEIAAELAVVHGHLGERAKGLALLEAAYEEQRRLAPASRCVEFCALGEIAATVLRRPSLARAVAALRRAVTHTWTTFVPAGLPALAHQASPDLSGHTGGVVSLDERRPRLALVPSAAA